MEITLFTHDDNIRGTDGYSSTTQCKCSAVRILVWSDTLAKRPISDTVFTSGKCLRASSLKKIYAWVRQTGQEKHFDDNN